MNPWESNTSVRAKAYVASPESWMIEEISYKVEIAKNLKGVAKQAVLVDGSDDWAELC